MCEFCEFWVKLFKDFVGNENTIVAVTDNAKDICDIYEMGNMTDQCYDVVKAYVEAAMMDFASNMVPCTICTDLRLCDDNSEVDPMMVENGSGYEHEATGFGEEYDSSEFDAISSTFEGLKKHRKHHKHHHHHHHHHHRRHHKKQSICEIALSNAQILIHHYEADKNTIKTLNSMCSSLHVSSKLCKQFVNEHLTNFLNFIIKSTSDHVCSSVQNQLQKFDEDFSLKSLIVQLDLDVSIDQHNSPKTSLKGDVSDDTTCSICLEVAHTLETSLAGLNWDQVKEQAEEMCADFPSLFKKSCKKIVDDAVTKVSDALTDFNADRVCAQIGLCPGTSDAKTLIHHIVKNSDELENIINKFKPHVNSFGKKILKKVH